MDNTLKILIEADAAGLNSQLKRAGQSITSFVGQMNKQDINWEKILSGSISPAIIAGIASTFALAITEAVGFQNSMVQAANNSSTEFQSNMGQAGKAALDLQSTTGQSASDIATGLGIATKALGNYASGQALVTEASKFSLATGIDLLSLVNMLTPAMQQWGITDASEITKTIQGLFGVADQGKVSVRDLIDTMSNTGGVLRGKTDILSSAAALEAFSNQAGMTEKSAVTAFTEIANRTQNVATAAQNTVLGMGSWNEQNKILKDSGMGGLLARMESSLTKMGASTASILLNHAGFSPADTANIITASHGYDMIAVAILKIKENMSTLGAGIENNISASDKLRVAWGLVKSDLAGFGLAGANYLANVLGGIDALFHPMELLHGEWLQLSEMSSGVASGFTNITSGVGSILTTLSTQASNVMGGISSLFGGGAANVAKPTAQSPAGSTSSQYTDNSVTNVIHGAAIGNSNGVSSVSLSNKASLAAHGFNN